GDVVATVVLRGAVEGGEPHRIDAEVSQVLQARGDARQVPDAVTVPVGEGARVDLVDHGITPPRGARVGPGVQVVGAQGFRTALGHRWRPSSSALIIVSAARLK